VRVASPPTCGNRRLTPWEPDRSTAGPLIKKDTTPRGKQTTNMGQPMPRPTRGKAVASCTHYFTLLPGADVSMVTVTSCWTGVHVLCSTWRQSPLGSGSSSRLMI